MAKILCRTKGNANPKGKPRVYFTCHPEDFDQYFDKLCEDVFKTHDCAIFYTEDMTEVIREQDKATDLESNNLFIVPVTFRLLSKPNRAMDSDIPFAFEKHIPVLPFMMEPGIDEFYSGKFGELQYLNSYSTDITEISYAEKLKKYLESVLISDEMAKRVRTAFDAYIFLSYRKKDRRYANELMRLIHSHPECRDIAIWYDEFLTPGESFRENIEKALSNSKLFTLLVTPNLLEEPEGKPNFVMGVEYPEACKSGVDILPAEMEETDKGILSEKYVGIPQCVDPHDDEAFKLRLLESISKIVTTANDDDPTHNFLIGLAYLEGIDVEVDRQRGLDLITSAAEAELPEAMEKLYQLYITGNSISIDYRKAAMWAELLVEYYEKKHSQEHPDTLLWMNKLAVAYFQLGNYEKAKELNKKTYTIRCNVLGKEHLDTIISLSNLAVIYFKLGNHEKALELNEAVYGYRCSALGKDDPDTISALSNLALTYGRLFNIKKEQELHKKVYILRCKILGEEHPDTISTLSNLAATHFKLADYNKALELNSEAYNLCRKVLGEEHPDTIDTLNNLALIYSELGDYIKARELHERAYALSSKVLGEKHPKTLVFLSNLAAILRGLGEHKRAIELENEIFDFRCKVLGKEHPDTLLSMSSLALTYSGLNEYKTALKWAKKAYALSCKTIGETHYNIQACLTSLALIYLKLRNYSEAAKLYKKAHILLEKLLGREHPETLEIASILKTLYKHMNVCQYCGGPFKGLFRKKCRKCGKPINY